MKYSISDTKQDDNRIEGACVIAKQSTSVCLTNAKASYIESGTNMSSYSDFVLSRHLVLFPKIFNYF